MKKCIHCGAEVPEEEAQNNLEMFEREYLFYDAEAQ